MTTLDKEKSYDENLRFLATTLVQIITGVFAIGTLGGFFGMMLYRVLIM